MGCGESKHAVATENTIRKSESSNANTDSSEEVRSAATEKETPAEIINVVEQEAGGEDLKPEQTEGDHGNNNVVEVGAIPEPKDTSEHQELPLPLLQKDGTEKEVQQEQKEQEREEEEEKEDVSSASSEEEDAHVDEGSERLISQDSPDHYFSSRKDHEALEGIVSDVGSEYNSPQHANANKPTQEQTTGELKAKDEEVPAVIAETTVPATDSHHRNPAPQT